jgi:hypothetical protein
MTTPCLAGRREEKKKFFYWVGLQAKKFFLFLCFEPEGKEDDCGEK